MKKLSPFFKALIASFSVLLVIVFLGLGVSMLSSSDFFRKEEGSQSSSLSISESEYFNLLVCFDDTQNGFGKAFFILRIDGYKNEISFSEISSEVYLSNEDNPISQIRVDRLPSLLSSSIGVSIDSYVLINRPGLEALLDGKGLIEYNNPRDVYIETGRSIHVPKGQIALDSNEVFSFICSSYEGAESSASEVFEALLKQKLLLSFLEDSRKVFLRILEYTETDINAYDIERFTLYSGRLNRQSNVKNIDINSFLSDNGYLTEEALTILRGAFGENK